MRPSIDQGELQRFALSRRHVLDDAHGVRDLRKQSERKIDTLCSVIRANLGMAARDAKRMRDTDNRDKAARELVEMRRLVRGACPRGK